MSKRVIFEKNCQKKFLNESKRKLGTTWKRLSEELGVNYSTLRRSYRYELCSLPYLTFREICALVDIDENKVLLGYKARIMEEIFVNRFKSPFGYARAKTKKVRIKYDNTNLNLDVANIDLSNYDKRKNIQLPATMTPELAEEVGMQLGDGFLSERKNEYRLKGNLKDEREYYEDYIKPLFKKLFNFEPNTKAYETTYGFEVYSKALWEFKTNVLGIPAGRKTNIRIPDILKVNDVKILCALVRGYFDTDGGIYFKSRYGYKNYSPEIQAASVSKQLISDFKEILDMLGFRAFTYRTKKGYYTLFLRGYENLKRYYELIGWSNPKQRKKVEEWIKNYPQICEKIGFRPKLFIKERCISNYERL